MKPLSPEVTGDESTETKSEKDDGDDKSGKARRAAAGAVYTSALRVAGHGCGRTGLPSSGLGHWGLVLAGWAFPGKDKDDEKDEKESGQAQSLFLT